MIRPILYVLQMTARATARRLGSIAAVQGNNLFLLVALIVYGAFNTGQPPYAAMPFAIFVGIVVALPLSSDPLEAIPSERLSLWPLSLAGRAILRLLAIAISPMFWAAAFVVLKHGSIAIAVMMLLLPFLLPVAQALATRLRVPGPNTIVPLFPGRMGGLFTIEIRHMLTVLDTYVALLIAAAGAVYRSVSTKAPEPESLGMAGVVIALIMSTYAQTLFGLGYPESVVRLRLLPLRGFEVLASKGVPYLAMVALLSSPLSPRPALAFALIALAIGHHKSVLRPNRSVPWRFAVGRFWPAGFLQVFGGAVVGIAEARQPWSGLPIAITAYAVSVWLYGRVWERQR